MEKLSSSNIDYLIADRHYMDLARVETTGKGEADVPATIIIGEHSFSAVILPPAFILSQRTATRILEFAEEGGTVVLLGDLPQGSPEVGATDGRIIQQMEKLKSLSGIIDLSGEKDRIETLPEVLDAKIPLQFRKISGDIDLVFSHRKIAGLDFYWIVSRSDEPGKCSLKLRDGQGRAEIWDCETGEIKPVEYLQESSAILVDLYFQPYQAYWLVFNANETRIEKPFSDKPQTERVLDESSWLLSLPDADTVRVSTAEILMSHLAEPGTEFLEIPESTWSWQKILGEVNVTEPWYSEMFFIPQPSTTFYYRYSFNLGEEPERGFLNISADDIFTLWVNGKKMEQGENSGIWYRTDTYTVGEFLRKGKNTIAAEVENTGGPGSFMLQGRCKTADGGIFNIETGKGWKESRKLIHGWYDPGFDDSLWDPPLKASDQIYSERIGLFDNPEKNIGPHEYVWWRINTPPGAVRVDLPGIPDRSRAWSEKEDLEISDSGIKITAGTDRIYIRHNPREYDGHLTSPISFQCEGKSQGKIGSWYNTGLHRFTGFVDHETTIQLEKLPSEAILDLGRVLYMAEVWINGKNAGARLWRPFRYDISGLLSKGENSIHIRVGNLVHNEMSLINDLEETINFWGKTGIPLHDDLDAGLFGPVKIIMKH
jgi:hypothetical protein